MFIGLYEISFTTNDELRTFTTKQVKAPFVLNII